MKTRVHSLREKIMIHPCSMPPPLHGPGSGILDESSDTASQDQGTLSKFSRRSFLSLTAALASCTAADPLGRRGAAPGSAGNYSFANGTASNLGPVPRNPDLAFKSNFSGNPGLSFSKVSVPGNYIAMTFDDGPHPQNTPRLLDILRARNIKATFYVIGRNVNLYPQVLRRTVAEGHEIGNHSQTHRLLSKLGDDELRTDLSRCRDAIGRAAGVYPRTMRPPYGGLLQRQRQLVHDEFGYPTILWSVDPLDWKRPGAAVITSRILHHTSAGGIVLAHDLHSQSVDAMPATLNGLLRAGFKFVTVSQLLAMKSEVAPTQLAAAASPY
jgi:peptidoglycan/xylan/chitin deacetylase (PgdA/CDA1 family)